MQNFARAYVFALLTVGLGACDPSGGATSGAAERHQLGKADALAGSCGTVEENFCGPSGAISPDGCFCDPECVEWGDCCADSTTVCSPTGVACHEIDASGPNGEAQCEFREDCTLGLLPDCPGCTTGVPVCSAAQPPISCSELDAVTQRAECIARQDCGLFFEAACPVCPGGIEVCGSLLPQDPPPVECSALDPADPALRAVCNQRSDCLLFVEAACDTCQGGKEICLSNQPF